MRYAARLPPSAELDLTTMRASGRARVTRVPVGELKWTPGERWGIVNLRRMRDGRAESDRARQWWKRMGRVEGFFVGEDEGQAREKGVWREVLAQIKRKT